MSLNDRRPGLQSPSISVRNNSNRRVLSAKESNPPRPFHNTPRPPRKRSRSAPSKFLPHVLTGVAVATSFPPLSSSLAAVDDDSDSDGDWMPPDPAFTVQRAVSVGSKQYGFTSLGRGFNWLAKEEEERNVIRGREKSRQSAQVLDMTQPHVDQPLQLESELYHPDDNINLSISPTPAFTHWLSSSPPHSPTTISRDAEHPAYFVPRRSQSPITHVRSLSPPPDPSPPRSASRSPTSVRRSASRSPTSVRPPTHRRSSHKRVSLVAGRVSYIEDPPPIPEHPLDISRYNSQSSFLSLTISTRAPTPVTEEHYLGDHSISDYVISGEIGRGAYGMVKRVREKLEDGQLGPPLIIKQVVKSRILADCWKKHPKHGTIPIEIYVMSSISNTSYVLPPRRPWDPSRTSISHTKQTQYYWKEGAVVKGHPNICSLIDFFEDAHFYYLVMPSTSPPPGPDGKPMPSDLFDLVELYPQGLPAHLIRSYLGQIGDALCFLHSKDIVHRDIKDENVVLGPTEGKCILIDFGSSGVVRKCGWDTFSGTLDYAGPEILRGESYNGKEQDVWAYGVVAFVLLVGECPFMTPTEAQEGLASPFSKARMALDERCGDGNEGEEPDGGGRLGDARALVIACLEVDIAQRPTFEKILSCRFLNGRDGT